MSEETTQYRVGIEVLKAQRKAKSAERDLIGLEISRLDKAIWDLEWVEIERGALIAWLRDNGNTRIQIMNRYGGERTYCALRHDGALIIGGHIHNDRFTDNGPYFVKRNYEAW